MNIHRHKKKIVCFKQIVFKHLSLRHNYSMFYIVTVIPIERIRFDVPNQWIALDKQKILLDFKATDTIS